MLGYLPYGVDCLRGVLYVRMYLWSGRPLRGRVGVSISRGSRRDVGRAPCMAARAKSYDSLMVGTTDRRRWYHRVRLHLQSGRPLRDSVGVSSSGGRVSTTGSLGGRVSTTATRRPQVHLERSTAQRLGSGVYLPRLATRRRRCAVYCGLGKVL